MAQTFDLSVIFRVLDKASGPVKKIGNSLKGLVKPLNDVNQSFKKLGKTVQGAGKKMKDAGKNMSLKMTLPLAGFGALAIRTATTFQASMNMVGAVTKATGSEFKTLEKLAKDLGATTQFSASQAAEAMVFLGLAGQKTGEIIGSMPKVLELAASAQLDLASAANIVTGVMAGFQLQTEDLTRVNDVLVNAFTGAKVDLLQMGEAFRKVGPMAKKSGLDLETTAAIFGKLGEVNIAGTEAGTGLKRVLVSLQNPSRQAAKAMAELGVKVFKMKDGKPVLRDILDIVDEFEKSGAGVEELSTILGQFGGPIMIGLLSKGKVNLRKFREELKETGSAVRISEAQMKGLPGAMKLLASAFEAFQLALIGTAVTLDKIIRGIAGLFQWLSEVNPTILKIGVGIAILVAAIGPLVIGLGFVASGIGAIMALGAPVVATIAAISAAMVGLGSLAASVWANWEPFRQLALDIGEAWMTAFGMMIDMAKGPLRVLGKVFSFLDRSKAEKDLATVADPLADRAKDFILDKERALGLGDSVRGAAGADGLSKSETNVKIELSSAEGTSAKVTDVKQAGDKPNMPTIAYQGAI